MVSIRMEFSKRIGPKQAGVLVFRDSVSIGPHTQSSARFSDSETWRQGVIRSEGRIWNIRFPSVLKSRSPAGRRESLLRVWMHVRSAMGLGRLLDLKKGRARHAAGQRRPPARKDTCS